MTEKNRGNGKQQQQQKDNKKRRHASIHRAMGQAPSSSELSMGSDLIETLIDSDLPEELAKEIGNEISRDWALANLKEDELRERKFDLRNTLEKIFSSYPPPESFLKGEIRQEFGFDDTKEPLTPHQRRQIIDAVNSFYARATRSRGGWQQEVLAEQRSEQRVVEGRQEENQGWIRKMIG